MLNPVLDKLRKRKSKRQPIVIGFYGPSSTGKTTLTDLTILALAKELGDLTEEGKPAGNKVTFMSSAGIGVTVKALNDCKMKKGNLTLIFSWSHLVT